VLLAGGVTIVLLTGAVLLPPEVRQMRRRSALDRTDGGREVYENLTL